MAAMIEVAGVAKQFTLHNQGGAVLRVMADAGLEVRPGECVALTGPSGAGKSTLMRMIWGNYLAASGRILVGGVDVVRASPREILALRRGTLGYVSQFLRVVPRVPTLEVVAEPLRGLGTPADAARERAAGLLARLRIPETLWALSPTTFSGGEQQRVNIARGFVHPYPAMLLDEPTASLDPANRETVLELIDEAKARGAAIVGIFHDAAARARVADRELDVSAFAPRPDAPPDPRPDPRPEPATA
jgi:alpha-D-ribose 1-methylphosphonate 5-triphosphate synthase subunit PhnL